MLAHMVGYFGLFGYPIPYGVRLAWFCKSIHVLRELKYEHTFEMVLAHNLFRVILVLRCIADVQLMHYGLTRVLNRRLSGQYLGPFRVTSKVKVLTVEKIRQC